MSNKKFLLILTISFLVLIFSSNVCAQTTGGTQSSAQVSIPNPLIYDSFTDLVNAIINFLFTLSLWIAPIMFVVAGFFFLISQGQPDKVKLAKDIVLYTVIGLLVIFSAKAIIQLIKTLFIKTP